MERRIFIPGSRWLYFKLYTGPKTADDVLTRCVLPLAGSLTESGKVNGWFFIRYADPAHHLRLRFDMGSGEHYGDVMRAVYEALEPEIKGGAVTKVMCDTYVRELERYGSGSMDILEELFHADSEAVAELLTAVSELSTAEKEDTRWRIAVRLIDDTLHAFGLEPEAKSTLMERLAAGFRAEFGFSAHAYTRQLNDLYRAHRPETDAVLKGNYRFAPGCEDSFARRREALRGFGERLHGMAQAGTLEVEMDNLLGSILHMSMNRLFKSHNRLFELVIYDFISRGYKSALAVIVQQRKRAGEPVAAEA